MPRGQDDLVKPIATRRRTSTYAPASANTRLRQLVAQDLSSCVGAAFLGASRTDLFLTGGPLHTRQFVERAKPAISQVGRNRSVRLRPVIRAQIRLDFDPPAPWPALGHMGVVQEPIEQGRDRGGVAQQLPPIIDSAGWTSGAWNRSARTKLHMREALQNTRPFRLSTILQA